MLLSTCVRWENPAILSVSNCVIFSSKMSLIHLHHCCCWHTGIMAIIPYPITAIPSWYRYLELKLLEAEPKTSSGKQVPIPSS